MLVYLFFEYGRNKKDMCPMIRRPPGIEIALLGFIRQGPQHGYQIHQMLSDPLGLGPIWKLKQSQLYALLGKLEKDGLTWGVLEPQAVARPPRRVFHLTRAGQVVFQKWLETPVDVPRAIRQEFMAKVYFGRMEGEALVRKLFDAQCDTCRAWLEATRAEATEPASFSEFINTYRVGQIEATLAWLECGRRALLG